MTEHVLVLGYDGTRDREVYRAGLSANLPDLHIDAAANDADARRLCAETTVLVGLAHHVTQTLVDASPKLRMIQALTTGTDHLDTLRLPPGITIASARGVHGPQMSELAFLFMLALARKLPQMLRNQKAGVWQRWPQPLLRGSTVLVFGVGVIAEELARRCQAFGMRVIGISGRTEAPHFDALHSRARFGDVAGEADFVVILAPYSAATHHAVNADILARCKPSAYLINIARGGVVDEAALMAALASGRLAGAGLDVFSQEPLPQDHPLWRMEQVILTPHIGGMSPSYAQDLVGLVTHNVRSFADGDTAAMRNLIRTGA